MSHRPLLRLLGTVLVGANAVARLRDPHHWDILDDLDLAIHEAGHVVFTPFGDHVQFLGGSLFQLLVPLFFVGYFVQRRQGFAASIVLAWGAASLLNVSQYIGDAQAQALPLLGGDGAIHDWWYLLTEWGLLKYDATIALFVRALAAIAYVVAIAGGLVFANERGARGDRPIRPSERAREWRGAPAAQAARSAGHA